MMTPIDRITPAPVRAVQPAAGGAVRAASGKTARAAADWRDAGPAVVHTPRLLQLKAEHALGRIVPDAGRIASAMLADEGM